MAVKTPSIKALRKGNRKAVEQWFRAHSDFIYTFVYYRVGGDRELVTDLVQETFATAMERLADFDPGRGEMKTWLSLLARNCIRVALRQRNRFAGPSVHEVDEAIVGSLATISDDELPDEVFQREETAHLVRLALTSLSPNHQTVLVERYWRQRPLVVVAADLGITEGAVKARLHRARLAFKDALLDWHGLKVRKDLVTEVS